MMTRLFALLAIVSACGDDRCDPFANTGCDDSQACERVTNGDPICAAPVVVVGRVFDLGTNAGVSGARVVALDANGSAVSFVAVTDSSGNYTLGIPTDRNADGTPSTGYEITLRADASGYVTFPSGIRPALPFSTANPTLNDGRYVLQLALTDIGLLPVAPGGPATGSISGTVDDNPTHASSLVVAEINGRGYTAIAGRDGDYRIFNVPAGSATVSAYALGNNYKPASVDVVAGKDVDADLHLVSDATSTVAGSVNIVNGQLGEATSVILVVESTFNETIVRGEVPPGLRAPDPGTLPNITNNFSIAGVPAGRYVVFAGFENDHLVRDASTIGGTEIVHQEVLAGQDVAIANTFKVTGSVDMVFPGANGPELVTSAPTFEWIDDSSEDRYAVTVFDSYGNVAWESGTPKSVVTLSYGGPALQSGMYYQVRIQSIKDPSEQISKSEDLKGVFYLP